MAGLKFVVFILVLMDQLFKLWAYNVTAMTDFNIIPGVFRISYVENYGAAFNLFTGSRWLLIGVTGVLLLIIGYLIFGKKITRRDSSLRPEHDSGWRPQQPDRSYSARLCG